MRRVLLLLAVAAAMVALMVPVATAFAAPAGLVEGIPEGDCPPSGGFVEKTQPLPPGSEGNLGLRNDTPQQCFKELENAPEAQKEHFGIDPIEIQIEDNTRHNK